MAAEHTSREYMSETVAYTTKFLIITSLLRANGPA